MKDIIGLIFCIAGTAAFILGIIGNYKFNYVLNRMHAAGLLDSFALSSFVLGCIIINGLSITSAKLIVAAVCVLFTSPVSTHMLSKLEEDTNSYLDEDCEVDL